MSKQRQELALLGGVQHRVLYVRKVGASHEEPDVFVDFE